MRFPVRRVLMGFAAGAAAGWAAGLLRTPSHAPAGSSADEAAHLPQEEFGTPADLTAGTLVVDPEPVPQAHPAPRKATAPAVKPPPGSRRVKDSANAHPGGAEPAAGPEVSVEEPAAPRRTPRPRKPASAAPARAPRKRAAKPADPTEAAAAALREGHAVATERLADAEAEATPPPDEQGPARRRRRTT